MIHGRLFLLGAIRLTVGPGFHGTPVDLRTTETALLLAYLALNVDRPVHRQQLAFRLWPDCDEPTARRHLRQHLHRLRQLLQGAGLPADTVESHARQLRFQADAGLWVDVHAFERLAADRGRHIEGLEVYGGDLLAQYDQPWILPERVRLRDRFLSLLRTQIDVAKMGRNYPRAVHYAERLVDANPLRESSHRIYLEALYLNGQRAAALRHYQQLRDLLDHELDVAPMVETAQLAEQIRAGTLPRDVPIVGPGARELAALREFTDVTERLIGRRNEIDRLDHALSRAQAGRGAFFLLMGESGRGKSFLLDSWLAAREGQMLALRAGCPPTLLGALGSAKIDWSLFPDGYPGLEQLRDAVDRATAHNRLTAEQVANLLLTLVAHSGRTVTVAMDDLDRAEDDTWDALAFAARRCAGQPLLLVGVADPARLSMHARRLWHALRPEAHVTSVTLGALSPADCATLAQQRLDEPLTPALRNALYRETEGHAGHVVAFCREAGSAEALPAALGRVPPPVAEKVAAQMTALPVPCREIVRRAAATGRSFSHDELRGALARNHASEPELFLSCLQSALDHGLLVEFGDGYAFPHRLTRRAVAEDRPVPAGDRDDTSGAAEIAA